MDEIVKEELWRSVAVFFFALLFVGIVTTKLEIEGSIFTVIVLPLLITIAHFMIKIYIKSGEAYKPPKLSAKFVARIFCITFSHFYCSLVHGYKLEG